MADGPGRVAVRVLSERVRRALEEAGALFARHWEAARRFLGFLTIPAARVCCQRCGWMVPERLGSAAGNALAR